MSIPPTASTWKYLVLFDWKNEKKIFYHGNNNVVNQSEFWDDDGIPKVKIVCKLPGEQQLGPVYAKSGWQYVICHQVIVQILVLKLEYIDPHVLKSFGCVADQMRIQILKGHLRFIGRRRVIPVPHVVHDFLKQGVHVVL